MDRFLDTAMQVKTKEEADGILEEYVPVVMGANRCDREKAIRIAKSNIGYWAGYHSLETRQRVESLFGAVHPVMGTSFGPQPTAEEMFEMGRQLGASVRHGNGEKVSLPDRVENLRAEIIVDKMMDEKNDG